MNCGLMYLSSVMFTTAMADWQTIVDYFVLLRSPQCVLAMWLVAVLLLWRLMFSCMHHSMCEQGSALLLLLETNVELRAC